MRMRSRLAMAALAIATSVLAAAPNARAQNPDTIPAAESTAKAKAIIQEMIAGLGGPAYLNVRDSECTGRLTQFGPMTGELSGFIVFHEYRMPPDKLRREYSKKGQIIDVYNGNNGWSLDKGGVEDTDAVALANFQSGIKMGLDNLLRYRLSEPGLYFHYGGEDVVDLRHVDWVEIEDGEDRTFRIAVDRETQLPVHFEVVTRNPQTLDLVHDVTVYSNWHPQDGVQTPFQSSRSRDDKRVSQIFYDSCKYNTGLSADMFTREALAKRWADMGHKAK